MCIPNAGVKRRRVSGVRLNDLLAIFYATKYLIAFNVKNITINECNEKSMAMRKLNARLIEIESLLRRPTLPSGLNVICLKKIANRKNQYKPY
jgi:hypothetical protein